MEKIIEDAEIKIINEVYPTFDIVMKMNNIIEEFLRKNKNEVVLYGGFAIKELIKEKNRKEKDEFETPDYDMYSMNHLGTSIEIANLLFEAGFKYVRRVNAMNLDTFRVGAEFAGDFVADVTFLPRIAFEKIGKYQLSSGISCINPQFLKIDLYASVTRPHVNVYRWEKSYKRLEMIENLYPIEYEGSGIGGKEYNYSGNDKKDNDIFSDVINELGKVIIGKKDILFTGDVAYNMYMKKIGRKDLMVSCSLIEIFTIDSLRLVKKINKLFKSKFLVKHQYPYITMLPRHDTMYVKTSDGNIPVIVVYDIGFDGIVPIKLGDYNYFNYHYLIRHMYIRYILAENNNEKNKYIYTIKNLLELGNNSNYKFPFERFLVDGVISENTRGSILAPIKRTFYNNSVQQPVYKPEKRFINSNDIQELYIGNYFGEEIPDVDEENISMILSSFEDEQFNKLDGNILKSLIE